MNMFRRKPQEAVSSSTPASFKEYTLKELRVGPLLLEEDACVKVFDCRVDHLFSSGGSDQLQFSQSISSEVHPLAAISTLSSTISPSFTLQPLDGADRWAILHKSCLKRNKTINMVLTEGREIILVAMRSEADPSLICFWGFLVQEGIYESSSVMFNKQFVRVVIEPEGTLVRSYYVKDLERKIDLLKRTLPTLTANQSHVEKRINIYADDLSYLIQFRDDNKIAKSGMIYEPEDEIMTSLPGRQHIVRPVIRLRGGRVFTRLDPSDPNTSVLVRVNPSWDKLSNCLQSIGSKRFKRFEVYVCTGASESLALEVWRILDPDSKLILSADRLDRIITIDQRGTKKSLSKAFHKTSCNPKMAMVLDENPELWDEMDKPWVFPIPNFDPYIDSEAEVSPLVTAERVAGDVRRLFFEDFCKHESKMRKITSEYDVEKGFPSFPDMGGHVTSQVNIEKRRRTVRGVSQMLASCGNVCLNASDVHASSLSRANDNQHLEMRLPSTSFEVQYRSGVESPQSFARSLQEISVKSGSLQSEVLGSAQATTSSHGAVMSNIANNNLHPSQDSNESFFERFFNLASQKLTENTPLISVRIDATVFGENMDLYLGLEDIGYMCHIKDLSENCVMMYIMHLYDTLKMKRMQQKYEFINPTSVNAARGSQLSQIIASRLRNCADCEWVFAPFSPEGASWVLLAVDMVHLKCYWLDPSDCPALDNIKQHFHVGLKDLPNGGRRTTRSAPIAYNVKCPKPRKSAESGFYIMKFMRAIINQPNMLTRSPPFLESTYNQDEIDDVRVEWIKAVEAHVKID